jgi:hypothetical protein
VFYVDCNFTETYCVKFQECPGSSFEPRVAFEPVAAAASPAEPESSILCTWLPCEIPYLTSWHMHVEAVSATGARQPAPLLYTPGAPMYACDAMPLRLKLEVTVPCTAGAKALLSAEQHQHHSTQRMVPAMVHICRMTTPAGNELSA